MEHNSWQYLGSAALPLSRYAILEPRSLYECRIIGNPSGRRGVLFGSMIGIQRCTIFEFDCGPRRFFRSMYQTVGSCTFEGTASEAALLQFGTELHGTIVHNHSGPIGVTSRPVRFSNLPGGPALDPTNIDADPVFFAPLAGDLRLAAGSPCIDTGSATMFDSDGSLLDMGAITYDPIAVPGPRTYCPGKITSEGCVPELRVSGAPSFSVGLDIALSVTELPPFSFGLFFVSPMGVRAAAIGQMSPLCTGSPSVRTPVLATGGSGACTGSVFERLSIADLVSYGFVPLNSLHFQFIARDPANPDGTGYTLSNAVQVLAIP